MRGKVTLASGLESDFYVDMRRATLHHEAAPLIGHVMLDMLEEAGLGPEDIDAVGGLTMGADPVATAMLHAAASRGLDLDAFVVRKAAKDHGMRRRIEGPEVAGRRGGGPGGGCPGRPYHHLLTDGPGRAGVWLPVCGAGSLGVVVPTVCQGA